jgi:hypothetical protein
MEFTSDLRHFFAIPVSFSVGSANDPLTAATPAGKQRMKPVQRP